MNKRPDGILCPSCFSTNTAVVDTRPTRGGIKRRRNCGCGARFNTVEEVHGIAKGPGGRPRKYSEELRRAVLADYKSNKPPLKVLCARHDVPLGTVKGWLYQGK